MQTCRQHGTISAVGRSAAGKSSVVLNGAASREWADAVARRYISRISLAAASYLPGGSDLWRSIAGEPVGHPPAPRRAFIQAIAKRRF